MSVIADLQVPATKFELGRILAMEQPVSVVLETMVPMGQQTVPFFWVHDHDRDVFEEAVREHHAVERLREVEVHEHRVLYAFPGGPTATSSSPLSPRPTPNCWRRRATPSPGSSNCAFRTTSTSRRSKSAVTTPTSNSTSVASTTRPSPRADPTTGSLTPSVRHCRRQSPKDTIRFHDASRRRNSAASWASLTRRRPSDSGGRSSR